MRRPTIFLTTLLAATALAGPAAAATCLKGYSFAGVDGTQTAYGITAKLSAVADPRVEKGHVAAWVGVGGYEAGPNRTDEWIEVGLNSWEGISGSRIFYEVTRPHDQPRVTQFTVPVASGELHKLAVLEMRQRRSWWRVWVDGAPVSEPIYLPQSHGRWYSQALGESWNAGTDLCNRYSYRFDRVRVASAPGGGWKLMQGIASHDEGYGLANGVTGSFIALTSD